MSSVGLWVEKRKFTELTIGLLAELEDEAAIKSPVQNHFEYDRCKNYQCQVTIKKYEGNITNVIITAILLKMMSLHQAM